MNVIQHLRMDPAHWTRRQLWSVVVVLLALSAWTGVRLRAHWLSVGAVAASLADSVSVPVSASPPASSGALPASIDFTATLPSPVDEGPFLSALERAIKTKGLTLQNLSVTKVPPTERSLERVAVQVALNGAYLATVGVVQEVLNQFPGSTLQSLQFNRNDQGGVDAALVLNLWGRSLPSTTDAPLESNRLVSTKTERPSALAR